MMCSDPCSLFCGGLAASGCDNSPTDFGECLEGCHALEAACPTEFTTAASCVGVDADYTCTAEGPAAKGCETEQSALLACADTSKPEVFCKDTCADVVAAACEGGPTTTEECEAGCKFVGEGPCANEQLAVVGCAGSDPKYMCMDPGGFPTPEGCETESAALQACLADG